MFFFIGGVQPRKIRMNEGERICPVCGQIKLRLERVDHYFSLFFIPLFPVKKGVPMLVCTNCLSRFDRDGSPLEDGMAPPKEICPRCGRSLGKEFIYCPYCGKKL